MEEDLAVFAFCSEGEVEFVLWEASKLALEAKEKHQKSLKHPIFRSIDHGFCLPIGVEGQVVETCEGKRKQRCDEFANLERFGGVIVLLEGLEELEEALLLEQAFLGVAYEVVEITA